jgi:hypothetical protein
MFVIDKVTKEKNICRFTYFEISNPTVMNTFKGTLEAGEWLMKAINNKKADDIILGRR